MPAEFANASHSLKMSQKYLEVPRLALPHTVNRSEFNFSTGPLRPKSDARDH